MNAEMKNLPRCTLEVLTIEDYMLSLHIIRCHLCRILIGLVPYLLLLVAALLLLLHNCKSYAKLDKIRSSTPTRGDYASCTPRSCHRARPGSRYRQTVDYVPETCIDFRKSFNEASFQNSRKSRSCKTNIDTRARGEVA